jgi:hypothetical protein
MHWNEDLLSPVRSSIDIAFRAIIDESCDLFRAEAAQDTKEVIRDLDHKLKSTFIALNKSTLTDHMGRRPEGRSL